MVPVGDSQESITGILSKVVFTNPETGFLIGVLEPADGPPVTIKGRLADIPKGASLEIEGSWVNHPNFGRQFEVASYKLKPPDSAESLTRYLGGGLIKGIGEKTAAWLVEHFDTDLIRVLDEEPERLQEVPKIGEQKAQAIAEAWQEQRIAREIHLALFDLGIGTNQAKKLAEAYGRKAPDILRQEPYRVAREIPGIGFLTADQLGLKAGLTRESPERLRSGLLYLLETLEEEGHTGYPAEELAAKSARELQVSRDVARQAVEGLLEAKDVVPNPAGLLQLPPRRRQEEDIARAVWRISRSESKLPPIQAEKAADWAQERAGFAFAPEQREAILSALRHPFSVLTGGPGTGKTTILRALVSIVRAKRARVLLASPTGRAAQRLAESAGHAAGTIHRLLAFDPARRKFVHNENRPLEADMLIVDEAGMLDTALAWHLFRAVAGGTHVVLVGDADQLPSVGAGQVLADLIAEPAIPVVRLARLFRQGEKSRIAEFATFVRDGRLDGLSLACEDPEAELVLLPEPDPRRCAKAVIELIRDLWPTSGGDAQGVQVLTAMHRGENGTRNLNEQLQRVLNPLAAAVAVGGFAEGDRVIATRNDYDRDLFNGDVGIVRQATPQRIEIDFSGNVQAFTVSDLGPLQLAYALTVHKAQGSEYPIVVLPIAREQTVLLERHLLYTAITRARKRLILVGDTTTLRRAIKSERKQTRHTGLGEQLCAALG